MIREETRLLLEDILVFRKRLKLAYGDEMYYQELQIFKDQLLKAPRPAWVTFVELADLIAARIDQNRQLREEAKTLGKALYITAAVELMGTDEFIEWMNHKNQL